MTGSGIGSAAIGACRVVAQAPDVFRGRIYYLSGVFDKSAACAGIHDKNLPLAAVFDKTATAFISIMNEV